MTQATPTAPSSGSVLLRISPFVFIVFCTYLTVGMPLAALPLQVHGVLGWNTVVVGIAVGVQSLATLATRPFSGTLCDRRGSKVSVLLGGCASALGGAIYLLSTVGHLGPYAVLGILLIARAVLGLAESLLMTGGLTWAIGAAGPQNTGKAMVWIGIGMYAAVAAGAPIGVQVMTHAGTAGGFVTIGVATIVFSLVAMAPAVFLPALARQAGTRLPFTQVAWRIIPFGTGLALATLGFAAIGAFAALDFQAKGWPGGGFALSGFGLAYIVTRMIFGGWPDRFGGIRVATWSLAVECAGQALLWLAPHPSAAFAGTILAGAGFSLVFPSLGIEAVRRVPAASRGAALGAYVAFFDVGVGLAGPITGVIAGAFGFPAVFACGALVAAVAIVAVRHAAHRARAEAEATLA